MNHKALLNSFLGRNMKKNIALIFVFGLCGFCFSHKYVTDLFVPTDTIRFERAVSVTPANDEYVYFTYINDEGQKEKRIKKLDTKTEAIINWNVYPSPFRVDDENCYINIAMNRNSTYVTRDLKQEALKEWDVLWGTNFYRGVALIENDDGYCLINSKGTLLADGIKRTSASDLYDGIFSVSMKDGRAGFMNLEGKLVFEIPQEYKDDGNRPSYSFWDGVMVITNGLPQGKHKCAVIDKNGNILGETEYFLSNFSDGLASFAYTVTKNDEKGHPATTEVFGYMDKHCNIVIPAVFEQNYVYSRPKFSNGYAEVNYRGRDLLLGKNGILYSKETNQPVFDLNKLKSQE